MPSIGAGELVIVAIATASASVPLLLWIGLVVWSRRVGARYPEGSLWRRLWLLPVASLAAQLVGVAGAAIMLVGAFSTVADTPAAERSAALADGISNAMNGAALGIVASIVLLVGSVIAVVVGQLRAPRP